MRKVLRALAKCAGAILLLAALAFLALPLKHRRPPLYAPVAVDGGGSANAAPTVLRILTWNLGYAGLGSEADFFMDGGAGVVAQDAPTVRRHLANIVAELQQEPADFDLLQEVDSGSRRSYWVDERGRIASALEDRYSSYTLNYDVTYVPIRSPVRWAGCALG